MGDLMQTVGTYGKGDASFNIEHDLGRLDKKHMVNIGLLQNKQIPEFLDGIEEMMTSKEVTINKCRRLSTPMKAQQCYLRVTDAVDNYKKEYADILSACV